MFSMAESLYQIFLELLFIPTSTVLSQIVFRIRSENGTDTLSDGLK